MDIVLQLLHTLVSFFVVLSVIVFIHEYGHYIVAKMCGVKIEAFSIGFGKEIAGWTDKSGTRWKVCLLPLGGYVKMFGDASAASTADDDAMEKMSEEEKKLTFHHKPLHKKMAIVAAGPFFNFLLTIVVFMGFIYTSGLPSADPIVGEVMPDTPAMEAGLLKDDRIIKINDDEVKSFSDIPYLIATNLGTPVDLTLLRDGKEMMITLTPKEVETDDGLGNTVKHPVIGIKSIDIKYQDVGLFQAFTESAHRTYMICTSTLRVIGQMVTGQRSPSALRGPIGIAQMSGQATDKNIRTVLWLIAMLSANLGLVNLFPIPLLDGGHLLFYVMEAFQGRPLAERVQEWSFKFGAALLFSLMAFTLYNDISKLL